MKKLPTVLPRKIETNGQAGRNSARAWRGNGRQNWERLAEDWMRTFHDC